MAQPAVREIQKSVKIHTDEIVGAYRMKSRNRGVLLLVNIMDFPDPQSKRSGAETDSKSLEHLFEGMDFKVCSHDNLSQQEFFDVLGKLTSSSFVKETECFVLVLMSHGTRENDMDKVIFNDGAIVDLQRIENHFRANNCPHLVGKPKVLIFPFCRGDMLDRGFPRPGTSHCSSVQMESTLISFTNTNVATLADTLICYGNTAGFATHRDTKSGNWYIQKFCDIMAKYAHNTHLEDILKKTQAEAGEKRGPYQSLQTGSFVNIGFNKKLFFNPGVYITNSGLCDLQVSQLGPLCPLRALACADGRLIYANRQLDRFQN
ncbi:hypothetical protein KR084_003741 [Drosophila pseudotakahashii]|nr:hypothetical protein KR084_003741 [Drosophila pseudotakahashii]